MAESRAFSSAALTCLGSPLIWYYWRLLVPNPLHVLEQNLLSAAVIEFRGPAVGVTSDALSGFKGAVIFQKIRDAGRAEGVRRIVSRQSNLF
jgi:hypothetical protein